MRLEWTSADDDGIYVKLIPETPEEKERIVAALSATGTASIPARATLYVEDDHKKEIHGVTTDPDHCTGTHLGDHPNLVINAFW